MKKKKSTRAPQSKYRDSMCVDIYRHVRAGKTLKETAELLTLTPQCLQNWYREIDAVKYAVTCGKEDRGDAYSDFKGYVFERLSPELQELWNKIDYWQEHENAVQRIESLMNKHDSRIQQSLWLHAFVVSNFNPSEACRKLCIPKSRVDKWIEQDPQFPKLLEEITWHKKNFFEDALVGLVKRGNPLAVIFGNKTLNKDRGYAPKVSLEHSGTITHEVKGFIVSVSDLELPFEIREQLLDAVRSHRKKLEASKESEDRAIDVPVHVVRAIDADDEDDDGAEE